MIDEVDNAEGVVSVVLFAVFDPKLCEGFPLNDVVTAVAEENLRTWDQINDRKSGPIVAREEVAPGPGNSGLRIKFKPALLLEGFRPGRIIRLWCRLRGHAIFRLHQDERGEGTWLTYPAGKRVMRFMRILGEASPGRDEPD